MKYKLKEIFDLQMGKTPARNNDKYWNTKDYKWISIADLTSTDKYINNTKEYISRSAVKESGIKIIPANTVVMSFKLSIGKTAILSEDMYSNEAIMAFHDKHVVELLPEYTYYLIKAKNWNGGSNRAVMGQTLNKATLSEIEVDVHTIDEQRKIVELLNLLGKIIYKRNTQLSKLRDILSARFFELFINTDYRYEKEPLNNNIKEMFIGPFGSAVKNEVFVDKEKAFCMVYEQKHAIQKTLDLPTRYIDRKKFDELKRFTVMGGDIIVSCRGTIGEIYSVPDDAPIGIMHPSIMKIRLKPEKYCNLFFVVMLNQFMKENVEKSNGSGIKMAITAKDLGKELFVIPPIKEQMKFEKFVNQIDKSKLLVVSPPQIHIYKTITLL